MFAKSLHGDPAVENKVFGLIISAWQSGYIVGSDGSLLLPQSRRNENSTFYPTTAMERKGEGP